MGCQAPQRVRVVRLNLDANAICWQYSVNGNRITYASNSSLTNQIYRLNLTHGDLILFGMLPTRDAGPVAVTLKWLSQYCNANQVASYYYSASSRDGIFSVPVYHWVAPFENPRTLNHAAFYYEGEFLGYRVDGYQNMLRRIELTHPRKIFLLGSLYDLNSNLGPNEAPYENEGELLKQVVDKSHTQLLLLEPLLGF
jgi:hypothetical protein